MNPVPVRFLIEVGMVAYLRSYYSRENEPCPIHGYHNAMTELTRTRTIADWKAGGDDNDYPLSSYPATCECGYVFQDYATRHIFRKRLYQTLDGKEVTYGELQVGDVFYMNNHFHEDRCPARWTNCDGRHLHCVVPGNNHWDIDSRASNCTMKDDTTHRCWVRHGDPAKGEILHVDKAGITCQAGAGSIVVPEWHGFLHHNQLVQC